MDELQFLSVADLKWILLWVICMNGDFTEAEGKLLYRAYGCGGVSLEINVGIIEELVKELDLVTHLSVSSDPTRMADLLAAVARIIGQTGPRVTRPATAWFAEKLGAEFGVVSAVYLARTRRHFIDLDKLPWAEIYPAIRNQDQPLLTQIFEAALGIAQFSSGVDEGKRRALVRHDHRRTEVLMRYYERQFAPESSQLGILVSETGRELSAESYWNLRSIAEMEAWDDETLLSLIDEHLYPSLHFDLVHYNVTVSGSDWLRLYRWLHRSDGVKLCRLSTSSHPRS